MQPEQRHLAIAHLWCFSAGIDPNALDTEGNTLVRSLAKLLAESENDGRKEAATAALKLHSGVFDKRDSFLDEDEITTSEYDARELGRLLKQSGGMQ